MKNLLILVLSTFFISLSACSGSGSRKTNIEEDTISTFCFGDTIVVAYKAFRYLNLIKTNKYDEAVSLLRTFKNGRVEILTKEERNSIISYHKNVPVLDYTLEEYNFVDENHVRLTFDVEFMKKDSGSSIPNTVSITFEPQRINADWYLGLPDGMIRWGKVSKSSN